ncbi:MAG: hypothetical protein ACXVEF_04300 [Polyangiales bacterium]
MRSLALLAFLSIAVACKHDEATAANDAGTDTPTDGCALLFGTPNDQTGLGPDMCRPECACGKNVFSPPTYDEAFVRALRDDWKLATPIPEITSDPYAGPAPSEDPPDTVCGVLPQGDPATKPRPYTLVTYPSEAAAKAAGAAVTHFGRCGACSPLNDLAVYIEQNDLTAPVRTCGIESDGGTANVACLTKLGFDQPCAEIWAYNTAHTKSVCLDVCIANLGRPYHTEDGALNDCIQCDETKSGPVFKAVAGRTRRNSGLPNALCRPCSEVRPLVHVYR